MSIHGDKAAAAFLRGYNCAQAVALAYWHLPADFFLRVPQSARRHFIG